MNRFVTLLTAALLCSGSASADLAPAGGRSKPAGKLVPIPAPKPATSSREPAVVARQDPAIAELLKKARTAGSADAPANPKAPTVDEAVVQVPLGGQCGFAGCSSSTLVAFTYRTRGANTTTSSVLALVTCGPVPSQPCTAVPAEVRPASPNSQQQ